MRELVSEPVQFDVFLCHNGEDKPKVEEIAQELIRQGIKLWLDVWELPPGQRWQPILEQQIEQVSSAAVFIGSNGLGPWQDEEIDLILRELKNRQRPIIPVLLSTAPQKPALPGFLAGRTWVDFRQREPDPMRRLIWGITGKKPEEIITNDQNLKLRNKSDLAEEKLNEADREILTDLLIRSGRAEYSARRSLCIKIGIEPTELGFLQSADAIFAIELISYLHKINR